MRVEKYSIWKEQEYSKIHFTMYLQDNSEEIEKNRKHPAMIVCGGGGYLGISDREKEPIALYFLNKGYQVFVLDYRTAKTGNPVYPNPVYDLAKTISIVREHADEWNLNPDQIAIIGFSAGGHLCACMASQWQEAWLQEKLGLTGEQIKPNAVILSYPLTDMAEQKRFFADKMINRVSPSLENISPEIFMEEVNRAMLGEPYSDEQIQAASPVNHVTDQAPPTFIWHTATDEMVSALNSILFAKKLIEAGADCELHVFEKGPHGLSMANRQSGGIEEFTNPDVAVWMELAVRFLDRHFVR